MADANDILKMFSKGTQGGGSAPGFFGGKKDEGSSGARFTLQNGTEVTSRAWRANLTVAQAFKEAAPEISFDLTRAVAYKSRGQVIQPTTEVEPGITYSANTTHEMKG